MVTVNKNQPRSRESATQHTCAALTAFSGFTGCFICGAVGGLVPQWESNVVGLANVSLACFVWRLLQTLSEVQVCCPS